MDRELIILLLITTIGMTIALLKVRLGQPATATGLKTLGQGRLARATEGDRRLCVSRARILLVEDDGEASLALSMLLGVEGFEVIRAADVAEAYDGALAIAPNLVITDIELPHLSGLDLIRLFKQHPTLAHIPIIAVSAMSKHRLRRASVQGAAAVYQKPIEYERLIAAIKKLLPRSGVAVAGR